MLVTLTMVKIIMFFQLKSFLQSKIKAETNLLAHVPLFLLEQSLSSKYKVIFQMGLGTRVGIQ